MTRERWIPIGLSYQNQDAALDDFKALKKAGVRCEIRTNDTETCLAGNFPPNSVLIWVLWDHLALATEVLNLQKQTKSNPPILCEACATRSADVHITMFDEHGNSKNHNFCQECHEEWSPE